MNDVRHDHSRWGRGDQLGGGNLLTPERRLSTLRSIQTGALYDLSHEISPKAPFLIHRTRLRCRHCVASSRTMTSNDHHCHLAPRRRGSF